MSATSPPAGRYHRRRIRRAGGRSRSVYAPVEVILSDRTNHQVATAALSPGDIAWPLRTLLPSQPKVRVLMNEVRQIDRGESLHRAVIVDGGPTGVELAGALAEIGRKARAPDFRVLHGADCHILLIEEGSRILNLEAFPPDLSQKAQASLESLGVTVLLNRQVRELTSLLEKTIKPSGDAVIF